MTQTKRSPVGPLPLRSDPPREPRPTRRALPFNERAAERYFAYVRERYEILLRRRAGGPPPWTDDAILRRYRFCNVFREDDKTTAWMRIHLREPLARDDAAQVRAAVVFRLLNKIETGELIKDLLMPGQWDLAEFAARLRSVVRKGEPITGAAYMVKTPRGMGKIAGLLSVLAPFEGETPARLAADIRASQSLREATALLQRHPFVGPFMAYEMVTDLRHTPLLAGARDAMAWANAGPGCAQGIGYVFPGLAGAKRASKLDHDDMVSAMGVLLALSHDGDRWPSRWPKWEMRDVEHNLCEFGKYERTRRGLGRPKQNYRP
jgi:5-hmdU DNA kinase-like protein